MKTLEERLNSVPNCHVCKKQWTREDASKFFYYDGILACKSHPGVVEWWNKKLKEANDQLKKDEVIP